MEKETQLKPGHNEASLSEPIKVSHAERKSDLRGPQQEASDRKLEGPLKSLFQREADHLQMDSDLNHFRCHFCGQRSPKLNCVVTKTGKPPKEPSPNSEEWW